MAAHALAPRSLSCRWNSIASRKLQRLIRLRCKQYQVSPTRRVSTEKGASAVDNRQEGGRYVQADYGYYRSVSLLRCHRYSCTGIFSRSDSPSVTTDRSERIDRRHRQYARSDI